MPALLLKILKEGKSRALFFAMLWYCSGIAAKQLNFVCKVFEWLFFRVPLLARKKDLKLFSVSMSKVMALSVIKRFGSCRWPTALLGLNVKQVRSQLSALLRLRSTLRMGASYKRKHTLASGKCTK